MTKTDQDRKDFEAWTDAQCSDETRALWMLRRGTSYAHPVTRGAWEAWQAALAHERARAQGEPAAIGEFPPPEGRDVKGKHEACPFCQSTNLRGFNRRFNSEANLDTDSFGIQCCGCSICGPEAETEKEAVALWNKRVHPAPAPAPAQEPVAVPDGWKLVPAWPTYDQIAKMAVEWGYTVEEAGGVYDVILDICGTDAAPPTSAPPAESGEVERLRARIDHVTEQEGLGGAAAFWRPCTGCHETNEGYSAGFPQSKMFGCEVGSGCWECGGLGVIWEHYSEADLKALAEEASAPPPDPKKDKVAIKPLEWMDESADGYVLFTASSAVGFFTYGVDRNGVAYHQAAGRGADHADAMTAKDAAEADHRRLVLLKAEEIGILAAAPAAPPAESGEALGRFGHHPDPAVDFCLEVEVIQGEAENHRLGFTLGTPSRDDLIARIERAMTFRVGGDVGAVAAKQTLREIEADFKTPAPPPEPAKAEVVDGQPLCAADDPRIIPLSIAVEGECNGLAIDREQCRAILGYIDTETIATPPTAPAAARSAAEAKMHIVNLEQCSIFVESDPIKRAMTDAAAFIRASLPGEEA